MQDPRHHRDGFCELDCPQNIAILPPTGWHLALCLNFSTGSISIHLSSLDTPHPITLPSTLGPLPLRGWLQMIGSLVALIRPKGCMSLRCLHWRSPTLPVPPQSFLCRMQGKGKHVLGPGRGCMVVHQQGPGVMLVSGCKPRYLTVHCLAQKSESLTTLNTYTTHRDMRVPGKKTATPLP